MKLHKLYPISFSDVEARKELYYRTENKCAVTADGIHIPKGCKIDFLTYFNCFSIMKWKKYTTIQKLIIKGHVIGNAHIDIVAITKNKVEKKIHTFTINGAFEYGVDINDLDYVILGLHIIADKDCCISDIAYYGEFTTWKDLNIGVSICTFKREKYVNKTMSRLQAFSNEHPWLSTLVVDNGSTLEEKETEYLRIIHNPNYGGSGGFTRGLIENLRLQKNDYVLLMDDDIDLDAIILEKTHSVLCGIRKEYSDSFLSGAMLRMETPCIQHENTAYWGKIRLQSLGKGWNLSDKNILVDNELIADCPNQYGAWWYCCIPVHRIRENGLPLPVFVKGDDIEYGIRNQRAVIHMNGIGVWHESFEGKKNATVNYLSDRNMLIINHYVNGCNRMTFFAAICGRLLKRTIEGKKESVGVLEFALQDVLLGFDNLTKVPADVYFNEIRNHKYSNSIIHSILNIMNMALQGVFYYKTIHQGYVDFQKNKLADEKFWLSYLAKSENHQNEK